MRPARNIAIIAIRVIFALTSTHAAAAPVPSATPSQHAAQAAPEPARILLPNGTGDARAFDGNC